MKSRLSRRPLYVISPKLPVSDENAGIRSVKFTSPGKSVLSVFNYANVVKAAPT